MARDGNESRRSIPEIGEKPVVNLVERVENESSFVDTVGDTCDGLSEEINNDIERAQQDGSVDDRLLLDVAELRGEVEKVRRTFLERFNKWLEGGKNRRQEKRVVRREREFSISDNPKIIKDLNRRLDKIKRKNDKLKESGQDILSNTDDVTSLVEEYGRAAKEDGSKWEQVDTKVNEVLAQSTEDAIAIGDFEQAATFLTLMTQDSEQSGELSNRLFEAFLRSSGLPEESVSQVADTIEEYKDRLSVVAQLRDQVKDFVQHNPSLGERFDEYSQKSDWESRLVASGEDFLKGYDEDVVVTFFEMSASVRAHILEDVSQGNSEGWGDVLMWQEEAVPLAELMIGLKDRLGVCPVFETREKVFVKRILSLDGSQRDEALQKSEILLQGQDGLDWADMYGYILASSAPEITSEDLEKIPRERIKVLSTLPIIFGDEKVAGLLTKEGIQEWGTYEGFSHEWRGKRYGEEKFTSETADELVNSVKNMSEPVLRHARALQPRQKWIDGDRYEDPKIGQFVAQLGSFEYSVQGAPEEYKDEFFESTEPSDELDMAPAEMRKLFRSGAVANYWQYRDLTGEQNILNIRSLKRLNEIDRVFTDDVWDGLATGIRKIQDEVPESGIDFDVVDRRTRQFLERVGDGTPESRKGTDLLKYFSKGGNSLVRKNRRAYTGEESYVKRERKITAEHLYDFAALVEKYFTTDSELMLEIFSGIHSLGELEKKAFQAYLAGDFSPGKPYHADTPVLEGCLHDIVDVSRGYGDWEEGFKYLEGVMQLTREEKELFLEYQNTLGACDVDIIRAGDAKEVLEMDKKFPDRRFSAHVYKEMVKRPECIGLYYYLPAFDIDSSRMVEAVSKLTEIYDAGLDNTFYLDESAESSRRISTHAANDLLARETEALVYVANLVAQHKSGVQLEHILYLNIWNGRKTLAQVEEVHDLIVKQAQIGALDSSNNYVWMHDEQEITNYNLEGMRSYLERAKTMLGRELEDDERVKFAKELGRNSAASVAEKILSDEVILDLFLQKLQRHDGVHKLDMVADEYLRDPIFWDYLPPISVREDSQKMETHMKLTRFFSETNISMDVSSTDWWNSLYKAYEDNPKIFGKEFYSVFENRGIHVYDFVYLVENVSDELSPEQTERTKRFLTCFDIGQKELVDSAVHIEEESLSEIEKMHAMVGSRLPSEFSSYVINACARGKKAEEVILDMDELLSSSTEQYKDGFKEKHGISGYSVFERWWASRNSGFIGKVEGVIPKTVEKILRPLLSVRGAGAEDHLPSYHADAQEIFSLSPDTLANLEVLSARCDEDINTYVKNNIANVLTIAKSAHFSHIAEVLNGKKIQELLESEEAAVAHFCDAFSEDLVGRIEAVPTCITYKLVDAVDYLTDPSFPQMVEFANKMAEIFGSEFTISIYQLLLMDFQVDLENIKKLEEDSSQKPLTPEMLKRLKVGLEDESMRGSVTKTLMMFDRNSSLPLGDVLPAVAKLSLDLRWQAIFHNIGNFGWDVFADHMGYLRAEVGFSDDQISKLVVKLYTYFDSKPKKVNLEIFDYIWRAQREGKIHLFGYGSSDMAHLLNKYDGDKDALLARLTRDDSDVMSKISYHDFPKSFRDSEVFWKSLADSDHTIILHKIKDIPEGVLSPETWKKVVETAIVESPDLLWLKKDEVPFVEDQFERLLGVCIDNGNANTLFTILAENVDGAVTIEESEVDAVVARYIKEGGNLRFLSFDFDEEKLREIEAKVLPVFRASIEKLVHENTDDPDASIDILLKLARSTALPSEFMGIVFEFIKNLPEDDTYLHEKGEELKTEMIVQFDPTVRASFNNPDRLGKIKKTVVDNLIEIVRRLEAEGVSQTDIIKTLRAELLKIKKIYESTDSTESERRLIFEDAYPFENCRDLAPLLEDVPSEERAVVASEIVAKDLHEVLVLSGCKREIKNVKDQEKAQLAMSAADTRNRELMQVAADTGSVHMLLPEGALTHGIDARVMELMLETGNLSGELLGSSGRTDGSGILGVDVSKVLVADTEDFDTKYRRLNNLSYGDVHVVYGSYDNEDRKPYVGGVIGEDHELVRVGIASTEITAMIVKYGASADQLKSDIARKGFYIPLLDQEGNILFEPEEFDKMRVFYHTLDERGYPSQVVDNVYTYAQEIEGSGTKHEIVLQKARDYVAEGGDEDLVILVDFLRTNDLNSKSTEWYSEASYDDIMKTIKSSVGVKSRQRARTLLFGEDSGARASLGEQVKKQAQEPQARRGNAFIDAFREKQIPFIGEESDVYDKALVDLLFKRTSFDRLADVAELFTEQKKKLMRVLWDEIWSDLERDPEWTERKAELERYKELVIPTVAGSGGRGEIVLGSDLDYNLFVDDRKIKDEEGSRELFLSNLSTFVNTILAERINEVLEDNGIRADAGLAKADRQPFTLMSTIESFSIDLDQRRQEEEPTEIVDSEALFAKDAPIVQDACEALVAKNESSYLLESFIVRDLESGQQKKSFVESFEELYESAASGKILDKIKESLQRTVTFKIYQLMFRAFEGSGEGSIDKGESRDIPPTTFGKTDFLADHNVLNTEDAEVCKNLLLMAYKLRFLGELYSSEAQQSGLKKVKNVTFRLDDFSYEEREELFDMLKQFREKVLYK